MQFKTIFVCVFACTALVNAAKLIDSGKYGKLTYCTYEGRCTTPNGASATITSTAFRNDGNCPATATISAPLGKETCTSNASLVATGDTTLTAAPSQSIRLEKIQAP